MIKPKKGDRVFVVDDTGDHVVIRVREVVRAGNLRVVVHGPDGPRQHTLVDTDPPRYVPALHLRASDALAQYVRRREADIDTALRRHAEQRRQLAEARQLLGDYEAAERRGAEISVSPRAKIASVEPEHGPGPMTTDYCLACGESPDSGSHLPHGHAYVDPRRRS